MALLFLILECRNLFLKMNFRVIKHEYDYVDSTSPNSAVTLSLITQSITVTFMLSPEP